MCELQIVHEIGMIEFSREIYIRPALWISVILGILTALIMPKFVLFYEVSGNHTVADAEIIRGLSQLGIGFGTYGPQIRSQWVEDHMLNMVDGLQWITVNQSGCIAHIDVRERPETPKVTDRKGFSNIVASRSGVILEQTVWTGQPIKQPGDVVAEGELLVSGVVDLERTYLLTKAQAEIYAETWRKMNAVVPLVWSEKGTSRESFRCVWLEIGKRRIKIFGNSGISTAVCDKMISRKILSLPGDYPMPIGLLVESYMDRDHLIGYADLQQAYSQLRNAVSQIAIRQMAAGEIIGQKEQWISEDPVLRLNTTLHCREMIAKTVEANWIEEEYEND